MPQLQRILPVYVHPAGLLFRAFEVGWRKRCSNTGTCCPTACRKKSSNGKDSLLRSAALAYLHEPPLDVASWTP